MLGSRLAEGWWSRLSIYFMQVCTMGLMQSCEGRQRADYVVWWRRQHDVALLRWCGWLQAANTCCLVAGLSVLLLLGACGVFDTVSYEGWWH